MQIEVLKQKIETLSPNTKVELKDLTGAQNHYEASIVSDAFEGKSLIEQHRLVFSVLKQELDSGDLHALSLKTYTHAEVSRKKEKENNL